MADKKELIENFYDVLGVSQTASTDEITDAEVALRKVYEARSKQGDADATDILRRLNEAHATLAVPHRRSEYDRRPEVIANGFADVAYSPQIARFEKLRSVAEWLDAADPVRAATFFGDGGSRPQTPGGADYPQDLLKKNPVLDG